jgi:hypothetical protein
VSSHLTSRSALLVRSLASFARTETSLLAVVLILAIACSASNARTPAAPDPIVIQAPSTAVLEIAIEIVNDDFGRAALSDLAVRVGDQSAASVSRQTLTIPLGRYETTIAGPIGGYAISSTGCSGVAAADERYTCSVKLDDEEPPACNPGLIAYTYSPLRLLGLEKRDCRVTAGRVRFAEPKEDGDYYFLIDPETPGLVNAGSAHVEVPGTLVIELPCQYPPRTSSATAACKSFPGPMGARVEVGQRVVAAGYYISDRNHEKHAELHPAVFKVLGSSESRTLN